MGIALDGECSDVRFLALEFNIGRLPALILI